MSSLEDSKGRFLPIWDRKYCRGFRRLLKDAGVRPVRLPPYSPNLNAFAERWVKSIKTECLQFYCPMTRASVEYVIKQYVAHYNAEQESRTITTSL